MPQANWRVAGFAWALGTRTLPAFPEHILLALRTGVRTDLRVGEVDVFYALHLLEPDARVTVDKDRVC